MDIDCNPQAADTLLMRFAGAAVLFFLCVSFSSVAEETGYASFYAGKFQGRLTANGEVFDTKRFTAAHKTLPFNTIVRVTNIESGESTLARINDRGPFVEGRIIDLSRVAAADIGIVARGIAMVSVEVVAEGDGQTYHRTGYDPERFSLQVASFREFENAERLKVSLEREGFSVMLEPFRDVSRVIVDGVPREDILIAKARLRALGYFDVFVRGN